MTLYSEGTENKKDFISFQYPRLSLGFPRRKCIKSSRSATSEKYLRERFVTKGDIPPPLTAFVYHNNHLGERGAVREIFVFLFLVILARGTGDWASANYISLAQAYTRAREGGRRG